MRPGKPVTHCLFRACCRVDKGGENKVACENFTIAGALEGNVTAFAWCLVDSGSFQRPVLGSRGPCRMVSLLSLTVTVF